MDVSRYMSIPYRKSGRGRDGADCYGFVRIVIREELGIDLPLLAGKGIADESVYRLFKPLVNPEEMAIAFMQGGPFHEAHVGIFTGWHILNMTENGVCTYPYRRVFRYIKGFYAPLNP